jgi:hypothetical protein
MSDSVCAYHLTNEQLSRICEQGRLAPSSRDSSVFDCPCDVFLHNEKSDDVAFDGIYDLARFSSRNPQRMNLRNFTQLFCEKSEQVAFLSHNFYKEHLQEHIDTWELVRILFCDFFGDFFVPGELISPIPSFLPEDETCRETTESILRLPGQNRELQVLCRCLHWLEQTARRSDYRDQTKAYLNSALHLDPVCANSAIFDPDSNVAEYMKRRDDFSEPVYYAIRRGDPRFAAELLLKNKEYWFSSFIRCCAPSFFNIPYDEDALEDAPKPPPFLPSNVHHVPHVHANASVEFLKRRKYIKDEALKDNSKLLLSRHDILDCGSSAPNLLLGLSLLRSLRSDLIDDKGFMKKVLSALSDSSLEITDADKQLSVQEFLWKKLRAAWVIA